jgi:hypothetical protein
VRPFHTRGARTNAWKNFLWREFANTDCCYFKLNLVESAIFRQMIQSQVKLQWEILGCYEFSY